MKQTIYAIVLSMTAAILLVNASAEDLPSSNQPTPKAALKDSLNKPSSDLSRLIELLMKTGDDDRMGNLSPLIGLTGNPATKDRDFTLPRPKGKERRECAIVFVDDSNDSTVSSEKRPQCLYIQHRIVSGHDSESFYYRFSLDGKLEHALVHHGKNGDDGKPIVGSGVPVEKDINSPEVQKAFKAELAFWTKEWLKKEERALAKAKTSSASSEEIPAVSAQ